MAKPGGLTKWFSENWVDIGSKKKNGKFQASKAASMTKSQIRSAVSRKRKVRQGVGGKPTNVSTFA